MKVEARIWVTLSTALANDGKDYPNGIFRPEMIQPHRCGIIRSINQPANTCNWMGLAAVLQLARPSMMSYGRDGVGLSFRVVLSVINYYPPPLKRHLAAIKAEFVKERFMICLPAALEPVFGLIHRCKTIESRRLTPPRPPTFNLIAVSVSLIFLCYILLLLFWRLQLTLYANFIAPDIISIE